MKVKLLCILITCVLGNTHLFASSSGHQVSEMGNLLQVSTPYGTKLFFGDLGLKDLNAYQLEIPAHEFLPSPGASPPTVIQMLPQQQSAIDRKKLPYTTPEEYLTQANSAYLKGLVSESMELVDKALTIDPEHFRGLQMKGSLFFAQGEKMLARLYWQKALKVSPNNLELKTFLEKTH